MTPTDEKPMTIEALMKNMRRAWNLGQTYWQQADSESYADNKRSDLTRKQFDDLLETSLAAIEQYGRERAYGDAYQGARQDLLMWKRRALAAEQRGSGEPIATLHDDGHWTHPPGRDPLDRFSGKVRMEVYAAPQPPREPLTEEQIIADEIERLTAENRLLQDRHKFDTAEYARLTDLNSELTDKANQYLIENARLDRELAAANAEKKALQESLASEKKWGELWYFVSDEEPLAFETIVTQHAPKRWIDQAYNLMAAHTLRKGMT